MSTRPRKRKLPKLVIDPELQNCVPDPSPRNPKHDAKTGGERHGCDAAEMQRQNLKTLIEMKGVERPIYVWDREGEQVIVDGVKTYLAAQELELPVEVKKLCFSDMEEAKAYRWYVNVAAARRPSEDAAVWTFLGEYDWMVQQWRAEGRKKQGSQAPFPDSEKVNWRMRAAAMCQTTKSRIDAVYDLRREAERLVELSEEEREDLSPEEAAKIKMVEDGVKSVLSGARAASSVVSDIKGGHSRSGKKNKGKVNRVDNSGIVASPSVSDHHVEQADSLEYIAKLPVGAFKYLLGSPPYFAADVDYGVRIPWLDSWEEYSGAMTEYLTQACRIIPEGGGIIINVDDTRNRKANRYFYHTELITRTCLSLGMYDAGRICWSKQNVTGKKHAKGSNRRPMTRPNHEYVLAFFKGRPEIDFPSFVYGEANHLTLSTWVLDSDVEEINAGHWAMFSNFWEVAPSNHPDHPATFPPKLVYRMLTRFTGAGDVVFDSWTGTGTTAVQCVMTGRRFLGVEAGAGYAKIARNSIERAKQSISDESVARLLRIEALLKSKFVTKSPAEDDTEEPPTSV